MSISPCRFELVKGGILGLTELGGEVRTSPPTSLNRDISKNSWRILTKFSEDFTGDQVAHFRYFPACPRQIGPPLTLSACPQFACTLSNREFSWISPAPEAPNPINIQWFSIDMNAKCDQKLSAIILAHFPVNPDQIYDGYVGFCRFVLYLIRKS